MPMLQIQVASGASSASTAPNTAINARAGQLGDAIVSELQPRYYEATYRKTMFSARAALQATSLVGVTMVGLSLWNSSTDKNLVITKLGGNIVASSATQTGVVFSSGTGQLVAPTTPTTVVVKNGFIGAQVGAGIAYSTGTYVNAPTASFDLMHNTAAIATTGIDPGYYIDIEGSIVIQPQCYMAFAAVGAAGAAASNNHWIMWTEVPI